ncbi:adenylyl-sulfate kinase [Desulfurivibrio alkaliphilus]|uniref:Adenylyl-sulfate kinase n=1 Tax=Desulfurivibrio alkaliphilus (strain DSM 19089 / UNIQEM U267 / AHT2) TaxID=589865 RepID=D6Z2K7_DESAT|nr:adenylyl-sulfate kinase [Desulfurivibrio alkaliphilus]ADH85782.1 adenylylsulfate kinase [Desulfurivibrio alkaliphilus AHT 2]
MKSPNTVPYRGKITSDLRQQLLGQKSMVMWFTGLSGSGKSTIAHAVEEKLYDLGRLTYVFDGDNVRHGLCSDLSFSPEGRAENLRRISEMVKLFLDAGIICLTAFISPLRADRQKCRDLIDCGRFFEIYVKCSLEECERRDVKGLYKLARQGKIKNYTGVSAPYEEPGQPDLVLDTVASSLEECVDTTVEFILAKMNMQ